MNTFTLRLPRWPIVRLFSRNPLARASDRIEAVVLVLAVVVSLLAAPIAAAIGTAVHDARRHVYIEQAHTRHTVTATVIGDSPEQNAPADTITVPARWVAAGAEHTGAVKVQSTAKTGDPVEIWVDSSGSPVDAPAPTTRAAQEAVTAALTIWVSMAAVATTLFTATRIILDRLRVAGWQHDIASLVGRGDGHTTGHP